MDSLPPEIFIHLLNNLNINDQARIRQVSKTFDARVTHNLAKVTHVRLEYSFHNRRCEYALCFASMFPVTKRSVLMFQQNIKHASLLEEQTESFFVFLRKFCPAIEVIDAPLFEINFQTLKLFGRNLKYFSFHDIKCHNWPVDFREMPSLFPSLEAFDVFTVQRSHRRMKRSQIPFDHKEFYNCRSKKHQQPFLQWVKCASDAEPNDHRALDIPSNVKSLAVHGSFFKLNDNEAQLAESLEFLQCQFNPSIFKIALPNLKSAAIESSVGDTKCIVDFLTPSAKLEHLTLKLHPCKSIGHLFDHLNKFLNLKYLQINFALSCDQEESITFSFPPQLVELDFASFKKVPINFLECASLRCFTINYLPSDMFTFNFPNLTKFSLKQLSKRNMMPLLSSLKNSQSLQHLYIGTSYYEITVKPFLIQNLLNFLPHTKLHSLYVSLQLPFKSRNVFILKKSDVPYLREGKLEWKVPCSTLRLID